MGTEPSEWAKQEAARIVGTYDQCGTCSQQLRAEIALALDAAQRAASVRVVRPIETVIHPGGRHSTPEVFDLKPGQEIVVIERRAEAAADGVKDGHVRLPDGREVKVLGTLPMTVDGAIIGAGSDIRVFWSRDDLTDKEWEGWHVASVGAGHSESNHFIWADLCGNGPVATNVLYSTREAAEAAAGEGEKP